MMTAEYMLKRPLFGFTVALFFLLQLFSSHILLFLICGNSQCECYLFLVTLLTGKRALRHIRFRQSIVWSASYAQCSSTCKKHVRSGADPESFGGWGGVTLN